MPILDGVASILIGLILALTAAILARESKSLLIGERARPALAEAISRIARSQPGVLHANSALTVQLSPDQAVVALSVQFDENMRTGEIERCVSAIEKDVQAAHPDVAALFVKPQTLEQFRLAREKRFGRSLL